MVLEEKPDNPLSPEEGKKVQLKSVAARYRLQTGGTERRPRETGDRVKKRQGSRVAPKSLRLMPTHWKLKFELGGSSRGKGVLLEWKEVGMCSSRKGVAF